MTAAQDAAVLAVAELGAARGHGGHWTWVSHW